MKKRTFILFVVMGLLEASNMACGQIITVPDTLSKYILTPKAPDTPRINCLLYTSPSPRDTR